MRKITPDWGQVLLARPDRRDGPAETEVVVVSEDMGAELRKHGARTFEGYTRGDRPGAPSPFIYVYRGDYDRASKEPRRAYERGRLKRVSTEATEEFWALYNLWLLDGSGAPIPGEGRRHRELLVAAWVAVDELRRYSDDLYLTSGAYSTLAEEEQNRIMLVFDYLDREYLAEHAGWSQPPGSAAFIPPSRMERVS